MKKKSYKYVYLIRKSFTKRNSVPMQIIKYNLDKRNIF